MKGDHFGNLIFFVCLRPQLYTPHGTFYETVSFLEGVGSNVDSGGKGYHSVFTPFQLWLADQLESETNPITWIEFREKYSSDLEAFTAFVDFYKKFDNHMADINE